MKKIIYTLAIILGISSFAISQSPEAFKYQAVIRDGSGNIQANTSLGVQLSILQGSPAGSSVYTEEFSTSSNTHGIVNLEIGTGTTVDDFSLIDWSNGPYFLETSVDLNGGTSYTVLGTSELVSVPYALHAKTAASATETDPVFGASVAAGITNTNISDWNNDLVNDADSDPTNEIQTLSFSNDSLMLTNGGSIDLSGLTPTTYWSRTGNDLTSVDSSSIVVGLGTANLTSKLTVRERNNSRAAAISGYGVLGPTYGQLGVQGNNNHEGDTTLQITGREVGVLGVSIGISNTDNYGVFGHSNFWGGHFQHYSSGNFVDLGGSSYAMRIVDGNEALGKVLTSNTIGYASWEDPAWTISGSDVYRSSGFVGIGNTSPATDLHISQSTATAAGSGGLRFSWLSTDWKIYHSGTYLSFASGTTRVAYINNTTGAWTTTSDRRSKKDITPMDAVLPNVLKLEPVEYRYTHMEEGSTKVRGFIAQDVQKLFPDLVYSEDGDHLALAPSDFGILSIKAIQEQQVQIQDLKDENEALRKQLETLIKRVENLEK